MWVLVDRSGFVFMSVLRFKLGIEPISVETSVCNLCRVRIVLYCVTVLCANNNNKLLNLELLSEDCLMSVVLCPELLSVK